MNLTKITGSFDLNNQTVTIGMTLTAVSKFQIPLGNLGSLPIATANGGIMAQFNPFKLVGNASLSVLIFQVASASVRIGAGEGFNNADGMNAQANVNAVIVQGLFKMRIGKGVPGNPEKRRFAASATSFWASRPTSTAWAGRRSTWAVSRSNLRAAFHRQQLQPGQGGHGRQGQHLRP